MIIGLRRRAMKAKHRPGELFNLKQLFFCMFLAMLSLCKCLLGAMNWSVSIYMKLVFFNPEIVVFIGMCKSTNTINQQI